MLRQYVFSDAVVFDCRSFQFLIGPAHFNKYLLFPFDSEIKFFTKRIFYSVNSFRPPHIPRYPSRHPNSWLLFHFSTRCIRADIVRIIFVTVALHLYQQYNQQQQLCFLFQQNSIFTYGDSGARIISKCANDVRGKSR